MKKIKELSIKEEQKIYLEVLRFVSYICKRENLKFFLAYGSLLGAVRENRIIEWDDDIDIWMPREDLNKFCEVYKKYENKKYFLQTYLTDTKCVSPELVRICINGTYKWVEGCEKEKFNTGMYFDIFPLDNGFGTNQDIEDLEKSTKLHRKISFTLPTKSRNKLIFILKRLYCLIFSRRRYIKKFVNLIESHKNCESDILVVFAASYGGLKGSYFKKSYFDSVEYVQFEDMSLPIPKKYDELLKYIYGKDYMIPKMTKQRRTKAFYIE